MLDAIAIRGAQCGGGVGVRGTQIAVGVVSSLAELTGGARDAATASPLGANRSRMLLALAAPLLLGFPSAPPAPDIAHGINALTSKPGFNTFVPLESNMSVGDAGSCTLWKKYLEHWIEDILCLPSWTFLCFCICCWICWWTLKSKLKIETWDQAWRKSKKSKKSEEEETPEWV